MAQYRTTLQGHTQTSCMETQYSLSQRLPMHMYSHFMLLTNQVRHFYKTYGIIFIYFTNTNLPFLMHYLNDLLVPKYLHLDQNHATSLNTIKTYHAQYDDDAKSFQLHTPHHPTKSQ